MIYPKFMHTICTWSFITITCIMGIYICMEIHYKLNQPFPSITSDYKCPCVHLKHFVLRKHYDWSHHKIFCSHITILVKWNMITQDYFLDWMLIDFFNNPELVQSGLVITQSHWYIRQQWTVIMPIVYQNVKTYFPDASIYLIFYLIFFCWCLDHILIHIIY